MKACEDHPCCCFLTSLVNKSHTGESVLPLRRNSVKKRKSVWRRRIYRKYVSWNRLQKTQDEIYADVVLSRSRGSPGQWFPETEYLCASTIFVVGTSGIPPKLNYRSVKSYNAIKHRKRNQVSTLICCTGTEDGQIY